MAAKLSGLVVNETRDPMLQAWCFEQLAHWLGDKLPRDNVLAEFHRLNATEPNVFLFSITGGSVTLRDKPVSARHALHDHSFARAVSYHEFLASAIQHCSDLTTELAIFVGDAALEEPRVPIFAFQKPAGNSSILLPDPDLIGGSCYADSGFSDPTAYDAKRLAAVFVGATSGGLVTAEGVRNRSIPRVRSACFFQGHPDVAFRLPRLVQYDSAETEALLRAMGFGDGVIVPWEDQLCYRFLLSIDGNGATCSRVARSLASNSALLKYNSPHLLYYFSGLQPWLHFIPIRDDKDVLHVLDMERQGTGFFSYVATAGTQFAERFLTRDSVLRYTSMLLRLYATAFQRPVEGRTEPPRSAPEESMSSATPLQVVVHIQNVGDTPADPDGWAGARGSGLWIEGLRADVEAPLTSIDLEYQAALSDGSMTSWMPAGSFCGTQGRNEPLRGFAIRLSARCAESFQCNYSGSFVDGTVVGPLADGMLCQSPHKAAFEAIWVELKPREAGV